MPTLGTVIWISCRPLLKMWALQTLKFITGILTCAHRALSTSAGFLLARMQLYTPTHVRGVGHVMLKVCFELTSPLNSANMV